MNKGCEGDQRSSPTSLATLQARAQLGGSFDSLTLLRFGQWLVASRFYGCRPLISRLQVSDISGRRSRHAIAGSAITGWLERPEQCQKWKTLWLCGLVGHHDVKRDPVEAKPARKTYRS
jgi:hypothetical protein